MRSVVIGLGVQGNKRALVARSDLVAAVDPVAAKAQFKKIEDVALDSYDCAFVCTPDAAKFEILSYLLKNKKHVLVEKPLLAKDNVQLEELAALAKENKTTCYTAYNHRFEPHIASMKQLIDSGELGQIYFAKLFYGNGTARDVRNSVWRDQGTGVLHDLGSHLLDMVDFLFGAPESSDEKAFQAWSLNRFENKAYDHVIFSAPGIPGKEPHVQLEATLLSWKNSFRLEVFAEKGSAHIDGLCKWGPSTLDIRKRVLPSGRPAQTVDTLTMADPTWQKEYEYFQEICKTGKSNLQNDMWINSVINRIGHSK